MEAGSPEFGDLYLTKLRHHYIAAKILDVTAEFRGGFCTEMLAAPVRIARLPLPPAMEAGFLQEIKYSKAA